MSVDKIVDKLRKLIAHEKSARSIGNLHEAEAFAARIQEMLEEHKLGMDEIEYAEREAGEPIDWEPVDASEIDHKEVYNRKRLKVYWQQQLAMTIAAVNGCEIVNASGFKGSRFFFVGRTSDRQLCKILYIYLVELGEELCMKAAKEDVHVQREKFCLDRGLTDYEVPSWCAVAFRGWMKDFRKSWRLGFADAVCHRLNEMHRQAMVKGEGTTAMIHIKKDALALKEYLEGKIKKGTGSRRSGSNPDGYARGKSTGSAVALTPNRFKATTDKARLLN